MPEADVRFEGICGDLQGASGEFHIASIQVGEPFYRPTFNSGETSLFLHADLGWTKLGELERRRGSIPLRLQLCLGISWLVNGELRRSARPLLLPIEVSSENWAKVLLGFGECRFESIQIRFPAILVEDMDAAISRVREARSLTDRGNFEGALVSCRKGIEASAKAIRRIRGDLPGEKNAPAEVVCRLAEQALGSRRGSAVGKSTRGLLDLLNCAAHESGIGDFGRVDAEFACRQTAAILAMIAECLGRPLAS
ncbi:MAG: hypothetical protein U1F36_17110 [Planctomycetota bacterium]